MENLSEQDLLKELARLQKHIQSVEGMLMKNEANRGFRDRPPRHILQSEVELAGDFDVLEAEGVDISDTGLCFDLRKPLIFDVRFMYKEELHEKRCSLVWMKQVESGSSRLGFQFLEPISQSKTEHPTARMHI
ncbi:MAG: PilZ domain-containing protein [Spirochaetota bacterium]|jgi:hypothetical protein|nr:PilZ domain-containing protein [Spirochaetota bacterium]